MGGPNKTAGRELALAVVDAYARDPEGLTAGECRKLGLSKGQTKAIVAALPVGYDGFITPEERTALGKSGFSKSFIDEIAGIDGGRAIRERARWLGENLAPERMSTGHRIDFAKELREMEEDAFQAIPHLTEALRDENEELRLEVYHSISRIGMAAEYIVRDAVPILLEILENDELSSFERDNGAASALFLIKPKLYVVLPTYRRLLHDKKERFRVRALELIGNYGAEAKESVPDLIGMIERDDSDIQDITRMAMWALGEIGPDAHEAVPVIAKILREGDVFVSKMAAEALGKIGDAAIPALEEALTHEKECVRKYAADELKEIEAKKR